MDNKEKYAGLISRSPLFSLDKEKDASAYRRESYKMVEYLYCYLMACNEEKYAEYALEITETANRCINNYNSENGEFLVYFLSAMKVEYRRAYAKNMAQQMRGGIHIADADERNLRKLCKYLQQKGIEQPTAGQLQAISDVMDIPVVKIQELLTMNRETAVASEYINNDDGDEISLFDTVASPEDSDSVERKDSANELMLKLEEQYLQLQERSKPIVSAVLTAKICEVIIKSDIEISKYTFIDSSMVREFILRGKLPTQREIAERFGKNEASISRTVKEFLSKVKLRI